MVDPEALALRNRPHPAAPAEPISHSKDVRNVHTAVIQPQKYAERLQVHAHAVRSLLDVMRGQRHFVLIDFFLQAIENAIATPTLDDFVERAGYEHAGKRSHHSVYPRIILPNLADADIRRFPDTAPDAFIMQRVPVLGMLVPGIFHALRSAARNGRGLTLPSASARWSGIHVYGNPRLGPRPIRSPAMA